MSNLERSVPASTARSQKYAALAAVFTVVLAGTTWLALRGKGVEKAKANGPGGKGGARQDVPVGATAAARQDVPIYLTGLGSVTAFNTVTVKTRVDGQIVQVAFREGQDVSKDDLLVVIDPRPFEAMLSQARASLARDQAQLADARRNLDRANDLSAQGIVAQQQLDSARALVQQLEGATQIDQAQIEGAQLQLTYSRITAPVGGRVGLRLVDEGNVVRASDQNGLLVITQLEPIAVVFTLPEDSLPTVARQMRSQPLPTEAYGRDDQTKLADGTLVTIDNQIDQSTGTGKLKAVFANKDRRLWPNQFVNVRLLIDLKKNRIVVPSAALQQGPQGAFIYVVKPDKTAETRNVKVGVVQGAIVSIDEGLSVGELVVTDGYDKLQSGSKVQLRTEGAKPGSGNS